LGGLETAADDVGHFLAPGVKRATVDVVNALNWPFEPFEHDRKYAGAYLGDYHGHMRAYRDEPITSVPPQMPQSHHLRNNDEILFVNGINTTAQESFLQAQDAANRTGQPVVNVHVATNAPGNFQFWGVDPLGTMFGDAPRAVLNHFGWETDPAAAPLQSAIVDRLQHTSQPVDVLAHSMGGIVTTEALEGVRQQLLRQMSPQQADAELSRIHLETLGTASNVEVPGVQYYNLVASNDAIAETLGRAGDADSHTFRSPPGLINSIHNHLWNSYAPHINFDVFNSN